MQNHHRHLAAILFTDIVGYTSMMQENEKDAVGVIKHYNAVLERSVSEHNGEIVNNYGDGSLCIFPSASEAVECAIEIQAQLQSVPPVPLRIGLHIGEIFFEDGKALGDGVNIASRIQSLGQANTILFSKEIFDKIRNHPEFKAVSLGHFEFKNVEEPIEVFALANEGLQVPKHQDLAGKLKVPVKENKTRKTLWRKSIIPLGILLVVVASLLTLKYLSGKNSSVPGKTDKSIAILPFVNMSSDPQQDYFGDGMMDEILNHLYKMSDIRIISRTSTMVYKGSKKNIKEIAKELNVENLLEGSIEKDSDRIRIRVQLIDGNTDKHLWAETYQRDLKDVFAIQSDIAQQIAANLKIKIDPGVKKRIENIPTQNTDAYDLYLKAREKVTNFQFVEGKRLLEQSIALDSNFASAYADLAFSYIGRGSIIGDLSSKEAKDSALPLLNRALQLDENLASAYEYFALIHLWFEWDFIKAGSDWKRVFELNPSGMTGIYWQQEYVDFLLASGKFGEAIQKAKKGLEDKNNFFSWFTMEKSYYITGQFEKAVEICDAYSKIFNDDFLLTRSAADKIFLGRYKEAVVDIKRVYKSYPSYNHYPYDLCYQAIVYSKSGDKNKAENLIEEMQLISKKTDAGSPSYYIAAVYSANGERDQSLHWLEKAYSNHEPDIYWLNVEPLFKPLHGDKRFEEILKKVGLK